MTEKDLIKRVATNHLKKKGDLGDGAPIKDKILMASMALKMAANKQGVMQTKAVFEAIGLLLVAMATETYTSEDTNITSVGKRLLREHKQLASEFV